MQIEGPILLYGAGREARSTRAFLAARYPHIAVAVTVDSGSADLPDTEIVSPDAIDLSRFKMIVKSPGVSRYKPIFAEARAAGITVTSNLNLWAHHYRSGKSVIAITGTKGKSTTATLVHLMLAHSGITAILAGNVGVAPLEAGDKADRVVFELSSYQTADMDFAPDIVGITNLYPEHVDWHGSVERYYADKLNILATGPRHLALGAKAEGNATIAAACRSATASCPPLAAELDAAITKAASTSRLKGAHNLDNARLAARIALAAGATTDGVLAGIAAFAPLPHRLEELTVGGILFVDDSISTTPEATKAALAAYKGKRIALIAGGHEREQDYSELASLLPSTDVAILCTLPVTGTRLAAAARAAGPGIVVSECTTLETAMVHLARTGPVYDTIILSPGAPSYNQFKNFEERGEAFKSMAVRYFSRRKPAP